jgi:hypothetical protein
MKKIKKEKYLGKKYTRNGNIYKVFEVDIATETLSFRNLEKPELVTRETIKKFVDNYSEVKI